MVDLQRSVCDLFAESAKKRPNHVAISMQDLSISYSGLEAACSRLEHILSRRGVNPGDHVAIITTRCPEMVVCFLSVLRLGAYYTPIDLDSWSSDRISTTLATISPKMVLSTGPRIDLPYDIIGGEAIRNTLYPSTGSVWPKLQLPSLQPSDLAYVIFTSGTTSAPKGVMVPHRALSNYVQHAPFNMNVNPSDTVILLFSVAFDACAGVLFSTLCNGGTIRITSTSDFAGDVAHCSILPASPSLLLTLQPERYQNLHSIFLGGESPSLTLIASWQNPQRRIFNCYGPTETTCASLIVELFTNSPITLGAPMSNSQVLLLDANLQVASKGEICISGPGLAEGYFRNPLLTKQRFIERDGMRLYRTGDIGKWTKDGLEFVGREDSMVKNRGFLINLEAQVIPALQTSSGVRSATAVIHQGRLIGFVTPNGLDTQCIRTDLASRYDSFVVPDQVYSLDALPLTANGKVDRRKLKLDLDKRVAEVDDNQHTEASASAELSLLRRAISNVLSLPANEIDNASSFWDLGGNSLAAIRLLASLREVNLSISVAQLFQLRDIREISQALVKESEIPTLPSVVSKRTLDGNPEVLGQHHATPMTSLQLKMTTTSIQKPLINYILLSVTIEHPGQAFDTGAFRLAWQSILQRHSIFRTFYEMASGLQHVRQHIEIDWEEFDVEADEWEKIHTEQVEQMRRSIRTRSGKEATSTMVDPDTIFRLITVLGKKSRLMVMVHHSRIDGWSMSVILKEVQEILDQQELQAAPQFFELSSSHESLFKERRQRAHEFWSERLDGHLPPQLISLPKPTSGDKIFEASDEQSLRLDLSVTQMEKISGSRKVTSATIMYTAWAVLLSNYCGTARVTFGAVLSGRNVPIPSAQSMVGPLINTIPFPIHVDSTASVTALLSSVQGDLFEMDELQWAADDIVAELAPKDQTGLFDTLVALQYNLPEYEWKCKSVPGPWIVESKDTSEFGLTVLIESETDHLVVRILFDPSRFEASMVRQILENFSNTIFACLDPRVITVDDLRKKMQNEIQLNSLTQHSATFNEPFTGVKSVKDAFEMAADSWSTLRALESIDDSMTYEELDVTSNLIANHIAPKIGPGDVVAVASDGSLMWIVAVISVIKTGAIYCPIDVNLSPQRVQVILSESKASVCLIPNSHCQKAYDIQYPVPSILVEEILSSDLTEMANRLKTRTKPHDAACLVFTSGTTGKPKGIQAHHLGILSYISFPPARLHASPHRRNAQLFSVGFDACTAEIFGTLCYGATLVLKDRDNPFSHLQRVHATMATPSYLSTCQPRDLENLDTILLGGEAIPQSLADAWSDGRRLYNGYGPSECTVGSVFALLSPGKRITCGRPIPRMTAYILDEQRSPVPVGVTGEIYLSGIQVTSGYFNDEAQTQKSFLRDPFQMDKMMYRTGDLGRWTGSMELEFAGRKDSQVKVRGYRVEMQEVEEAILSASDEVINSAVILRDDSLLAFVTPTTVSVPKIEAKLKTALPYYCRPSQIIPLDRFPKSVNQKIDRKALAELAVVKSRDIIEPSTKTEVMLVQLWQEAIGLDKVSSVSIDDDLMDIGGHSLLQIKIGRSISERIGYPIPLGLIIQNTILADMGKAIDEFIEGQDGKRNTAAFPAFRRQDRYLSKSVSHLEEDMLVHHLLSNARSMFNIAIDLDFQGDISLDILERSVNDVIAGSDVFRSRFIEVDGSLIRQVSAAVTPVERMSRDTWNDQKAHVFVNAAFDLATEQPIRALIVEGYLETHLLLVAHHIVLDKAALAAILKRVEDRYLSLQATSATVDTDLITKSSRVTASSVTPTYLDWVSWSRERPVTQKSLSYWQSNLRDGPLPPFSRPSQSLGHDAGASRASAISAAQLARMTQTCHDLSVTPQQLLLAAVALSIHITAKRDDFLVAVPYMDRYEPGTSLLEGLLLDRQPLRFRFSPTLLSSTSNLLAHTKTTLQDARANYVPFKEIRKAVGGGHGASTHLDVMITYHSRADAIADMRIPNCTTKISYPKPEGAKFPLLFEFSEKEDGMDCEIEYRTNIFDSDCAARIECIMHASLAGLCEKRAPVDIITGLSAYIEGAAAPPRLIVENDLPAPSTDQQKIDIIRRVFAQVLGLERKQVSCRRSFFELGGSSLLALRVKHLLGLEGYKVGLAQVLSLQTAEMIAAALL